MENITFRKGDIIKIRTLDWFNNNKDKNDLSVGIFTEEMSKYCGDLAVITESSNGVYKLHIDGGRYIWCNYMFNINLSSVIDSTTKEKCINYCRNICKFSTNKCSDTECNIYKYIFRNSYDYDLFLREGDNIVIKPIDWFIESSYGKNIGIFSNSMNIYCGKVSKILKIVYLSNGEIGYKLSIDNGVNLWKEYMFDIEKYFELVADRVLSSICTYPCISECLSKKCPIYSYGFKRGR